MRPSKPDTGQTTLGLTPSGHLTTLPASEEWESEAGSALSDALRRGEGALLIDLATTHLDKNWSGVLGYWRELAKEFVATALKEDTTNPALPAATRDRLLATPPPLPGGEYLSEAVINRLWSAMGETLAEETRASGLSAWLGAKHATWRMVGRITLNLAENRQSPDKPFAFLATYTSRLGSSGRIQHTPFLKILQEEARTGDRAVLLAILSPIERAAARSKLLATLINTKDIFRPLAWTPSETLRFLHDVPIFEESGLLVRVPDWWSKSKPPRPKVSVQIGAHAPGRVGIDAMLDFDVKLTLGDETLSPEEWAKLLESADGLIMIRGRWIEIDRNKLQSVLAYWRRAEAATAQGGLSFATAMRLLVGAQHLRTSGPEQPAGSSTGSPEDTAELEREWSEVKAGPWLEAQLAGLRDPTALAPVRTGSELKATLRPYQLAGVRWLWHLYQLQLGGCLADDMGLGKTIQILALLTVVKAQKASTSTQDHLPSLLVVPASLVGNWCAEADRFTPSLKYMVAHPTLGSKESRGKQAPEDLCNQDVVITTYGNLLRATWILDAHWDLVVLDEAQAIKSPNSRQTRAVKQLKSKRRLALTGTPVENRLQDLWSIFDFLNPGLLGSAREFATLNANAKGKEAPAVYGRLRALVTPYIMRRLKTDRRIINDLPPKTELVVHCNLTTKQAALYERTVAAMKRELQTANEDIQRRGVVLAYLSRFKQICNHPSQMSGDGIYEPDLSGKLRRLRALATEIASRQEKLLIFTQYQEMTTVLSDVLAEIYGRSGVILTGSTPVKERRALVDAFQKDDGPPYFVLSLKAGGTGLTLTAASQVIHFDRWWNPAVENQATDRAFRIGQKQRVLVHKFVCVGTIEERIDSLIAGKQQMATQILGKGSEVDLSSLSDQELLSLVSLDLNRATAGSEEV